MKLKDGKAIVRVRSHRALDKLKRLLGSIPKSYWKWEGGGHWYAVSPEQLQTIKAAKIKGITQSTWDGALRESIQWR